MSEKVSAKINQLLAATQNNKAAQEKVMSALNASISGGEDSLLIGLDKFDKDKDGIDPVDLVQYTQYLDKAVSQIVDSDFGEKLEGIKDPREQRVVLDAVTVMPKLKELVGKLPPDILKERADTIVALNKSRENVSRGFFSHTSENQDREIENIEEAIDALASQEAITGTVKTDIQKKGSDGVFEQKSFSTDEIPVSEFIARITGNSGKTARATAREASEGGSVDDVQKSNRLEKFITSFERKHQDEKYKPVLLEVHRLLNQGKTQEAADKFQSGILEKDFSEFKIQTIMADDTALAEGLRTVSDTKEAGRLLRNKGYEKMDATAKADIQKRMDVIAPVAKQSAEKKYAAILRALEGTTEELVLMRQNREKVTEFMAALIIQEGAMDGYIKEHGSGNLPEELKTYDDMKGLSGMFNFSDENAALTKSVAVMLVKSIASLILLANVDTLRQMAISSARSAVLPDDPAVMRAALKAAQTAGLIDKMPKSMQTEGEA
ncbi:MAG: hypothetical protein PHO48_02815 [Candidatus Gracilibacteria bacterium]|nr:hypothetical protein [Candidatus Gracilibacteria bacterium]